MYEKINHHPEIAPFSFPQQCPVCLHDIELKPIYLDRGKNGSMWLFRCPRRQCMSIFSILQTSRNDGSDDFDVSVFPREHDKDLLGDELLSISPHFVKTYRQACRAQALELDEIFGGAFRKAVEYLVKDFLIAYGQTDLSKDKILTMNLGQAVSYLPDQRLINLAKASVWLGNDQTHLINKHPDYGVEDLKKFIQALAAFTIYSMRAKQAEDFIND